MTERRQLAATRPKEPMSSGRLLVLRLPGPEAVGMLEACRRRALSSVETDASAPKELRRAAQELEAYNGEMEVAVDTLRAAYTAAQLLGERGQEGAPSGADEFWTCVVQHSKPAFPEYEKRKEQAQARAKETEEFRRKLHARAERREYDNMVKNVHWGGPEGPHVETRPLYQASIGFNMVAAGATAGFIGYYASRGMLSQESHRVIVGTLAAVAMLMVELILYIIRTTEVEKYQAKRDRIKLIAQAGGRVGGPDKRKPRQAIAPPPKPGTEKLKTN